MEVALRRELMEEIGVEVSDIEPRFFSDGQHTKSFANGEPREIYMIFLIFACLAVSNHLNLSPEFSDYAWVDRDSLPSYKLNSATIETFRRAGVLS